ncbi:hypothetical protein [Rhizobium leguminosarum]|uniref:hypothetical protein n=1 Tax=Rhizobium leguminosarum TaxID=384 RepID=UPI001C94FD1A|nr:hypothetical protein [Rhizobium leguminosarum]MBY5662921.1 hypothetical protein [Rhizobium leguminosarum]MBY5676124.1 hypothetical protein [Rhizobium leguminosarum]
MPSNTPAPPEKIYEAPSGGYDHALRTSSPSYNSSPTPTRRIGLSKDHYVSRPPAMLHQRPAGIGARSLAAVPGRSGADTPANKSLIDRFKTFVNAWPPDPFRRINPETLINTPPDAY